MDFASDNAVGASPPILDALLAANHGAVPAYGSDPYNQRAKACEAVIFFDAAKAESFAYRCKRAGHTLSKGRLLGVQMAAYLENNRWLDLARTANAQASALAQGLKDIPGVRLAWEAPANQVFAILPRAADEALRRAGARYYDWGSRGLDPSQFPAADEIFVRLVTSFATDPDAVRCFVSTVRGALS
jgi:threonine aldolase